MSDIEELNTDKMEEFLKCSEPQNMLLYKDATQGLEDALKYLPDNSEVFADVFQSRSIPEIPRHIMDEGYGIGMAEENFWSVRTKLGMTDSLAESEQRELDELVLGRKNVLYSEQHEYVDNPGDLTGRAIAFGELGERYDLLDLPSKRDTVYLVDDVDTLVVDPRGRSGGKAFKYFNSMSDRFKAAGADTIYLLNTGKEKRQIKRDIETLGDAMYFLDGAV
ncbi:MAG: hypothetical protein H8Z69_03240 [Nanohaloarchaea archaeon]|nr:hypothetical protein [Candidatus Nanohaloarchaea archaeon]